VKLLPWEFAHVFGFALADTVGEGLQLFGLLLSNLLVMIYFVVLVRNDGARTVHDFLAKTIVRRHSTQSHLQAP